MLIWNKKSCNVKFLGNLAIFVIFTFALFLGGCASTTVEKRYKEVLTSYPESHYIIGVGEVPFGYDRVKAIQAARDRARAEIAKQITVHIKSLLVNRITESKTGITTDFQSLTQSTAERTLSGVDIVWEGIDAKRKIAWAIAVLNRPQEAKQLYKKANTAYNASADFYKDALRKLDSGYFYSGLCLLLKSRLQILKGITLESEYKVLSEGLDIGGQIQPRVGVSNIDLKINDALSGISIEKISGDNQNCKVDEGLDKPLKVLLFKNIQGKKEPLTYTPCLFEFLQGKGRLEEKVMTDNQGLAQSHVYKVDKANTSNLIRASIDMERFSECLKDTTDHFFEVAKLLSDLKNATVIFTIKSEGLKTIVGINEYNLGNRRLNSIAESKIIKFLNETEKFSVLDRAVSLQVLDNSKVAAIYKGDSELAFHIGRKLNVDLMLIGEVSTEYLGNTIYVPGKGKQDFSPQCRAQMAVKFIDINTGEVKTNAEVTGINAFAQSEKEAGLKAIEKATDIIIEKLKGQFSFDDD